MIAVLKKSDYLEYLILTLVVFVFTALLVLFGEKNSYLYLPVFGIASFILYLSSNVKGFLPLIYILSSVSFFENNAGIEPSEIPFYLLSLIIIGYTLLQFVAGQIIVESLLDKLFLLLLFLLPYGVFLGIFNGASPYMAIGETTNFFGVLIYFPLKSHFSKKRFTYFLSTIVLFLILYVLIRNLINYRQLLVQAVLSWQAENARVAANEFILVFGSCLFMSAAAITRSKLFQLFFTFCFVSFIGALILTQSRGYWIAFFIAFIVIFSFIESKGKFKIIITFCVLLISFLVFASLFFGNFLELVFSGLSSRFKTLGSGKLDISLQERVLEAKTIFKMVIHNPISGYGFGYLYTKKILFYDHFELTSYVHNGYLATWFKLGLPGLFTIVSIWIVCIKESLRLYKESLDSFPKVLSLAFAGTVSGVILVNNTSPQILTFESMLFLTIFCAYLSSKKQT